MLWIFVVGGIYLGIHLIFKGILDICMHDYKVSLYKKSGRTINITFICNKCGKIKKKIVQEKLRLW